MKRLTNASDILTPDVLVKMKQVADGFTGKSYDLGFEWSDEKMYCSELVWKIYHHATGIEIGELEKLGDFDLTSKLVKEKMRERYGNMVPVNEKVISPSAIFNCKLLTTIQAN